MIDQKVVNEFRSECDINPSLEWNGSKFLEPSKHLGLTSGVTSIIADARLATWLTAKEFYQNQHDGELFTCPRCKGNGTHDYQKDNTPKGWKSFECSHCKGEGWVPFGLLIKKQPKEDIRDIGKIEGIMKMAGVTKFSHGMKSSIPFKLGDKFTTLMGTEVTCMELSETRGYECARFSDGGWRYNRGHDRGRCTGSRWDAVLNILPKFPEV